MDQEARRARRRRLTETIATRRRDEYIARLLNGDPFASRWARTSPHYWAKNAIGNCDCRKRHKGAPRRNKGMCDCGARHCIYKMRAQERELRRLVGRGVDPDDDQAALLTYLLRD